MRRTLCGLTVLLALLAPVAALSVNAPKRPDRVIVTRPRGMYPQKLRVPFPHQRHVTMACQDCHHTLNALGSVEKCSTSGCHDMVAPHCPREMRSGRYFKNAFHKSKASCRGCHKARQQAHENSGPTRCRGCHSVRRS
ncbi:cytochrome c3 family protein [Desulfobaculum sp.]|jgi:hypothetical protein